MAPAAVFLPLLGAAAAALAGAAGRHRAAGPAATCLAGAAFAASLATLLRLEGGGGSVALGEWISVGGFSVSWAVRADPLSAAMMAAVNAVSTLVHLYSLGYMAGDPHRPRFFAYLSLFTFAMLVLVSADNLAQLFLGWEGVGLCSYLLIGFWFRRPAANAAAVKAFLVNRVGDAGLVLGIAAAAAVFGSIAYDDMFAGVEEARGASILGLPALEVVAFLLFAGAMGKSAQLGLHTWLPDAMEGPTPVSALIHAATMVTAGVFLVARCAPLYEAAPWALAAVAAVGLATALFAGTVALAQNDIKRVIAWSTCSQLGYMFLACGVSAYAAGVFHLVTHAFFKALLFLGAGAVIHALGGEQDIRRMGGLARALPVTGAAMAVGALALTGVPPFAGFWSKDAILEAAFAGGSPVAAVGFWGGLAAALLTGAYAWRLVFLVFLGGFRGDAAAGAGAHEPAWTMRAPVLALALAACGAGWALHAMADPGAGFWDGVLGGGGLPHPPAWARALPALAGLAGAGAAWALFVARPGLADRAAGAFPRVRRFLARSWYFDELYDALLVRPLRSLGAFLARTVDRGLIDRFGPEGVAAVAEEGAGRMRLVQSGLLDHYALAMVLGAVALAAWILLAGGGP